MEKTDLSKACPDSRSGDLRFEMLLSELSSKFINLPASQVDQEIESAQRRICESLGLDISLLWQWVEGAPQYLTVTHLYRPLGGPPVPERIDAQELFPWSLQQMMKGKVLAIPVVAEMPPEAAHDREVMRYFEVKSTLNFSLSTGGGQMFGILGLCTVRQERDWPEALVKRLELIAQVFANALARKRSEQELRKSEERLNLAAESAGVGLWSLNLADNCFWLTNKARGLFGFSADETVTLDRMMELVHPQDRELIRQTIHRLVQSRKEGKVEYRLLRADQSVRWLVTRGSVRCNAAGEPVSLMGVTVDATERKLLEHQLRVAASEWQATFDSVPDLVMILDRELRVVRANAATVRFLGLPMDQVVGVPCHFHFLMQGIDRPEEHCPCLRAFRTGRHEESEMFHSRSGRWFLFSTTPMYDPAGKITGAVHIGKDITDRHASELERQHLAQELAHAGRVSTLAQLSSSLAHELNQPLGAILRNAEAAEIFLRQPAPDLVELRAIMADILKDNRRAGAIIDRMRSLLKRRTPEWNLLNLAELVEEVMVLVRPDALSRKVSLRTGIPRDLPAIRGDRVQLQQVLLNLMVNGMDAVAAIPAADRRLQIHARLANPQTIEVAVADSGPGIPGEKLGRLFEPFFTTKPNGMGLGLPISQTIIVAHGGRIWCENAAGGATFFFTVPADVADR